METFTSERMTFLNHIWNYEFSGVHIIAHNCTRIVTVIHITVICHLFTEQNMEILPMQETKG